MTIPWLSTHFDHPYPHRPVAKIGATKGQETSHPGAILVRELGTVVEGLIGQLLLVGCWDEVAIGRLIKSSQPLSRCFHALSSPSLLVSSSDPPPLPGPRLPPEKLHPPVIFLQSCSKSKRHWRIFARLAKFHLAHRSALITANSCSRDSLDRGPGRAASSSYQIDFLST